MKKESYEEWLKFVEYKYKDIDELNRDFYIKRELLEYIKSSLPVNLSYKETGNELRDELTKLYGQLADRSSEHEAYKKAQTVIDVASAMTGVIVGPEFELKIHKKK